MATPGVNQAVNLTNYQLETQSRTDTALNECNGGMGVYLLEGAKELNPIATGQGWMNVPYTIIYSIGSGFKLGYNVITSPFRFVYYFFRSDTPQEKACKELLDGGELAVNKVDLFGRGALMQKFLRDPNALKVFAKAGADANIRTHFNFSTVLHEIARVGDEASVNAILSSARAVNMNARDVNDMSPLHMAALTANYPVFEALLQAQANPFAVDRFGRTPLMLSARYCSDCFNLLVDKEINFLGRDKQNAGIWHYAAANPQGRSIMQTLHSKGTPVHQLDFNGESPLHYAAKFGTSEVVGDLVYYGADVNMLSRDGNAPIHLAAAAGMGDVIYKLAANGADVNLSDADQQSPLHLSAKGGFTECIDALVYNKAQINKVDQYGRSPLVLALLNREEEAAKKLVTLGADVNLTPYNGHSPLYIALKQNLIEIANLLAERDAVIKAAKNGELALHEAVAEGNIAKVNRLILEGYEFNQRDQDFQTPLMIALMKGDLPIAQLLINCANLNKYPDLAHVLDSKNRMAIHYAAMHGDANMVRQLLKVMTVSLPDVYNRLPLHYAAENGNLSALIEFTKQMSSSSELDLEDIDGYSPLNLAIMNKHHDVAEHLIKCGADVVRVNQEGRASIHLAAQVGDVKLAKMLLEKNSILINWKDNFGHTPLSYCEEGSEIQEYMISQGAKVLVDGYDSIQMAIMQNDDEFLEGFNSTELNGSKNLIGGDTNLHFAVKAQSDKAAKVLMSADGSLVNYQNEEGDTPLTIAARKGETSTLMDLLSHGSDVNISNKEGLTALHILARQGNLAAIRAIMLKHPNLNAYSQKGLTPLGVAISAKQDAVAFFLSEMGAVIKTRDYIYDNASSIPFLNLILADNFKEVQNFLLAGVSDVADNLGRRGLHYAVSLGVSSEMLTSLLNAGFDPNLADSYGRTPLMLAVQNGNFDAVQVLLKQNEQISRSDLEVMLSVAKEVAPYNQKIVAIIESRLDNES